jgi:NACHT domain
MTQFDQRNQQVDTQYNADHITIQQQPLSLTEKQRKQNRARMLQRVQAIWIDGIFEPSLQEAAQIALQVQNKPSAVVTPLWSVLREFDTTGQLSSENASIVQVYDHASGEVLLLGEPGSGKTTLLLELTRTLLERARQDEAHPIPVVFPLSSWATTKRQPLTTWLASELHTKYQIPLTLATSWIEMDQVLPLLDGLDEVPSVQQAACVEAINTYRREHGLLPTVVCSRQTDYLALSTRLLLRTAVVVQPLTPEQIASYLASGGERLEALHQTLREDADLRALASTPLMLNVLTAAYQGTPPQEITTTGSLGMKQEQVFASYVQRMLTHRNTRTRYTPQQTIHWLSYLAGQMKRQSQTVFYIEQMQPDWLSGTRMLRAYDRWAVRLPGVLIGILISLAITTLFISALRFADLVTNILLGGLLGGLLSEGSTIQRPAANSGKVRSIPWQQFLQRLLVGILIGLGVGLSYVLSYELRYGLSAGLSVGLCSILLQVLLVKSNTAQSPSQTLPPVWRTKWQRLIRSTALRNGLLAGLLVGLSYGLSAVLSYGLSAVLSAVLSYGLIFGLSYGLSYGLIFGLSFGLSYGLSTGFLSLLLIGKSITVQLTDRLIWSWTSLGRSLRSSQHVRATLQIAALVGLSYVLSYELRYGLSAGLSAGLSVGLSVGLIFGLNYWYLIGLFQGVSSETIGDQQRMAPNQGIRRSAFNGLVLGFISAMSAGLIFGLIIGLSYGLIIGLSAGLLAGLLKGGLASLRHYVLRFLLWRSGAIPWNYPHFLDNAYEQILLRKVGGGYIFLHRLLLDYFADLETGSDSKVLAEDRQEILPLDGASTSAELSEADSYVDAPTAQLISTSILSEVPRLLSCGHEQPTPNARFCSVCGEPVQSSSLE